MDKSKPAILPAAPSPIVAATDAAAGVLEQVNDGIVLLTTRDSAGKPIGQGSGFLVNSDGLIVTNFHVIRHATTALASFRDGTIVNILGVIGWSKDLDLAILKLEKVPTRHQVLRLCTGLERSQGMQVVAIGHPQGLKHTMTVGILSAVQPTREMPQVFRAEIEAPDHVTWLQTSATAAPGSSGGPLLNSKAEVLGINTWIIPKAGFTFSIDVRHLQDFMGNISSIKTAKVTPLAELTGPDESVLQLKMEYVSRMNWFEERIAQTTSPVEQKSLIAKTHPAIALAPQLMAIADKHPKTPAANDALMAVCTMSDFEGAPESCSKLFTKAADRLCSTPLDSAYLQTVLWSLRTSQNSGTRQFLKRVSRESKRESNRVIAELATAVSLSKGSESEVNEAIRVLEQAKKKYPEVEFAGAKVAELAEAFSYEFKFLSIGRVPPETTGLDQSGSTVRLADYRGKVVVVDFFVDWCPHCVSMYPLERRLVEEYKNQPFALLGINCDEPARLKDLISEKTVTWSTVSDGSDGPITKLWRVESFPKLFVLDHTGKIRYKDVRGAELSAAITKLMAEVPRTTSTPKKP